VNPSTDPLDTRLAQLPRTVAPARDLWPAIHDRLGSSEGAQEPQRPPQRIAARPRWLPTTALTAGVALAAGVALVSLLLMPRDPSTAEVANATRQASDARDAAFLQARAAVESDYERLMPQLAPGTRQRVEQALETIRRAEADILAALTEDPSNPLLLRLRQRAAQRQIDLMTTITRDAVAELPRSET
jgi:hypothetical protein